jgi:pimeloyl-ACP methyl ester carboxylesterase
LKPYKINGKSMSLSALYHNHLLRWIVGLALLAGFGLYIVLPVGSALITVFPNKQTVGSPPEGFEEIALTANDGVSLEGWYAPPGNGAVILLLHGAGGSREDLTAYADMLTRHGYGVLALDLRGHGLSQGITNRLGWESTLDVGAAVTYLGTRPDVQRIGGLGLSMGGETLLGAASTYPAMTAIVADGATRRSLQELLALPSERPLPRNFTARVMFAAVGILSSEKPPPITLLDSMLAAKSTSFFLIAGGGNAQEVAFNQLFAQTVGERVELWVAPDAEHTEAFSRYPEEYEQRVIGFFDQVLSASQNQDQ